MTMFELAVVLFAASLCINLIAWIRYALYGGAFKSNLIVGISATVLTFVVLIVSIIYSLPAMGIMVLCLGGSVISLLTGMKMNSALAAAGGIAGLGMMAVAAIAFVLVCYFFTPAIALQYCKANQFGDCFKFGEIFATIMRSPLDYLMLVLPFLAYLGRQFIPFVGQLLGPVLMLASSHLIGQYGAQVMEMSSNSPVPSDVGFNRF